MHLAYCLLLSCRRLLLSIRRLTSISIRNTRAIQDSPGASFMTLRFCSSVGLASFCLCALLCSMIHLFPSIVPAMTLACMLDPRPRYVRMSFHKRGSFFCFLAAPAQRTVFLSFYLCLALPLYTQVTLNTNSLAAGAQAQCLRFKLVHACSRLLGFSLCLSDHADLDLSLIQRTAASPACAIAASLQRRLFGL